MLAPGSREFDIRDAAGVESFVADSMPELILHAAAGTNNRDIEADPAAALDINIKGTVNIAKACLGTWIRLVSVSTDYVYEGARGNYSETDELRPSKFYAWTKLAGELD